MRRNQARLEERAAQVRPSLMYDTRGGEGVRLCAKGAGPCSMLMVVQAIRTSPFHGHGDSNCRVGPHCHPAGPHCHPAGQRSACSVLSPSEVLTLYHPAIYLPALCVARPINYGCCDYYDYY